MSHTFHEEEYRGCKIRIQQDECADNPSRTNYFIGYRYPTSPEQKLSRCDREEFFEDLSRKQLKARERLTGKRFVPRHTEVEREDQMELPDLGDLIDMALEDNVIVQFDYCSHDGEYQVTDGRADVCDGYVFLPMEDVRQEWGNPDDHARKSAESCIRMQLQMLTDWAAGNVAEWIAEDPEGNSIGACCGFYPDDGPDEWKRPISEARAAIDRWHEEQHELSLQLCSNI